MVVEMIYANWYGGGNYGTSDNEYFLEGFKNITAAKEALVSRFDDGYSWKQEFDYVNQDFVEFVLTPSVTEDCEMWIYYENPTGSDDWYPDAIIKLDHHRRAIIERV